MINRDFNKGRADVLSAQVPTEARIYDHIFMFLSESIVHWEKQSRIMEVNSRYSQEVRRQESNVYRRKAELARDTEAFLKGVLLRVGDPNE